MCICKCGASLENVQREKSFCELFDYVLFCRFVIGDFTGGMGEIKRFFLEVVLCSSVRERVTII